MLLMRLSSACLTSGFFQKREIQISPSLDLRFMRSKKLERRPSFLVDLCNHLFPPTLPRSLTSSTSPTPPPPPPPPHRRHHHHHYRHH